MMHELSSNTQAILLLTAPLIAGREKPTASPLTASEYRRLAHRLRELQRQPADLLESDARHILKECRIDPDSDRLDRLLGRGFLLSQAVERWQARAIWVVSRADTDYPRRLKERLRGNAPSILYGCGDSSILNTGGLAVVGSRNVNDTLITYTEGVGRLAAEARRTLVSGGARGIDQAAMRGALGASGCVAGVLGDGLERAVVRREYRDALMNGRLVLACPFDPAARFQVGHAMQRNKLIYALADAALVVNSDFEKGGTWTGAVEQLDKLKFVPVFVRVEGEVGKGVDGLRERGAIPWPNPRTPESLEECLDVHADPKPDGPRQATLSPGERDAPASFDEKPGREKLAAKATAASESVKAPGPSAEDEWFARVRPLLQGMHGTRTVAEVAEVLQVSKKQAGTRLKRFLEEEIRSLFKNSDAPMTGAEIAEALRVSSGQVRGTLKKLVEKGMIERLSSRPTRYRRAGSIGPLFDRIKPDAPARVEAEPVSRRSGARGGR